MGKYSLGKKEIIIDQRISKDNLFIDERKVASVEKKIERDLDKISTSLATISNLLNYSVNSDLVKGMRGKAFRSWAKKAKSQSNNASKMKNKLHERCVEDIAKQRIADLDKKISKLEKELAEIDRVEVK